MTKKHFILIAKILSKIEDTITREKLIEEMADACAKENKLFNRAKFKRACWGVDKSK